jgi:hypothetical protein
MYFSFERHDSFSICSWVQFSMAKRQKRGYGMETISGLREHKSTCLLCLVVEVEFRLLHLHVYVCK